MGPLQLLVPLAQGAYGIDYDHRNGKAAECVVQKHIEGIGPNLRVRKRHYQDESHGDDYDEGEKQPNQSILRALFAAPSAVEGSKAGNGKTYNDSRKES